MGSRLRIGHYIDNELKIRKIKKNKLYESIKENFHKEESYIEYKSFASRFYDNSNFYAQDLLEISYLLNIDLNEMRDNLINKRFNPELSKIKEALDKSIYKNELDLSYSYRYFVEDNLIFIVWFKIFSDCGINTYIEAYNVESNEVEPIDYISGLMAKKINPSWDDLSLDEKLKWLKEKNKKLHSLEYEKLLEINNNIED